MKVRLPRLLESGVPEAVLINTAGGLCDGDRLATDIAVTADAEAVITTQACERVYRAAGDAHADVENSLTVGVGAALHWLPQETILFDGGRLRRALTADMAADATLVAVEATILGRTAMGETVTTGHMHDRWRVRRDGRLVFAEDVRLGGAIGDAVTRPGVLDGACAYATVLVVSPVADARLDGVRDVLSAKIGEGVRAGASAYDGLLIVRAAAPDGQALRQMLIPTLAAIRAPKPLPRIWTT